MQNTPDAAIHYDWIASPCGRILVAGDSTGLRFVLFEDGPHLARHSIDGWIESPKFVADAVQQLGEYFRGERAEFDLMVSPQGTEFQRRVWTELQTIEYGQTVSYGEIARRIERPEASRAVGAANGRNPISIVIPCHRVVGASGKLTGYAGGISNKQRLLELEGREVPVLT